jgi:hypothetical protein
MSKENKNKPLCKTAVMHRILSELDFTKCGDEKYRRCHIHECMNVKLDEDGFLYVNAETEDQSIEIPITIILYANRLLFKDWLLFTYDA